MAGRIRTLKPEVLDNAKTAGLSDTAFRLFVALILEADDHGNGYGDVRRLKSRVWWATEPAVDVASPFSELVEAGLVSPYEAKGQAYATLTGWRQHQKVDKPGRQRVPPPEAYSGVDDRRSEIGDRRSEIINEGLATVSRQSRDSLAKIKDPEHAHQVLAALSAARSRVVSGARALSPIPSNLKFIGERLAEGASVDDCLHVIAVLEAEVRADSSKGQWFNAQTPFRPDNFARSLGRPEPPPPCAPTATAAQDADEIAEYRRIERNRAAKAEAALAARVAASKAQREGGGDGNGA